MASGRDKKIATSNSEVLNELHKIGLAVNTVAIIALFYFQRPNSKLPFLILSIPAWFAQFSLEKSGRPKYGKDYTGNLKLEKAGDDIRGPGLYEYMFDIIYITFVLDVIMIVFGTNYGWWLYGVIPAYAGFKLFGLVKPFLSKGNSGKLGDAGALKEEKKDGVSKRQQKMQARGQKLQVKYR